MDGREEIENSESKKERRTLKGVSLSILIHGLLGVGIVGSTYKILAPSGSVSSVEIIDSSNSEKGAEALKQSEVIEAQNSPEAPKMDPSKAVENSTKAVENKSAKVQAPIRTSLPQKTGKSSSGSSGEAKPVLAENSAEATTVVTVPEHETEPSQEVVDRAEPDSYKEPESAKVSEKELEAKNDPVPKIEPDFKKGIETDVDAEIIKEAAAKPEVIGESKQEEGKKEAAKNSEEISGKEVRAQEASKGAATESNLGRTGAPTGSDLPLVKTGIPEGTIKAELLRPLVQKSPEYPLMSRLRRQEGQVTLLYSVSDSGSVANIRLYQSSGHTALDQAAAKALRDFEYPKGRPAEVVKSFLFRLKGSETSMPASLRRQSRS